MNVVGLQCHKNFALNEYLYNSISSMKRDLTVHNLGNLGLDYIVTLIVFNILMYIASHQEKDPVFSSS